MKTCPTSLAFSGSVMSYCRTSPCSQHATYMKRSSREITKSVMSAGISGSAHPSTGMDGIFTRLAVSHVPSSFLKNRTISELSAHPTYPSALSGLCRNRTSSGIDPTPQSSSWMILCSFQSHTYSLWPVLPLPDVGRVEPRREARRLAPLRRDHHVVPGLVPEVVPEGRLLLPSLPAPVDLERLGVKGKEPVLRPREPLLLGTTHKRHEDLRRGAVRRVRQCQPGLLRDLLARQCLVEPRLPRVGLHVDEVDVPGQHTRDHQVVVCAHTGLPVAARARVPPHVVQLVPRHGHLQPVHHLRVLWALGIDIHRRQVVRLVTPVQPTVQHSRNVQHLLAHPGLHCVEGCRVPSAHAFAVRLAASGHGSQRV
eukprot:Sspe_Gene.1922::Locus_640_Transcript_1_1_Confidence_1.000_Length_1626::g.1922::m.1922